MPTIDFASRTCHWCDEHDDSVRVCESCLLYSCQDCKLGRDEAGCYHKKKEILISQAWAGDVSSSLTREYRLQDS